MSKWEFIAPKFWDLSESIIQNRPNDSWFSKELFSILKTLSSNKILFLLDETNTSTPSFPKKRKLRTKFDHRNLSFKATSNLEETVHDRLARESTISFSRKMNPTHKRFFIEHDPQPEPIKDTTTERIARLENAHKPIIPRKRLKLRSTRTTEPSKLQQAAELLMPPQTAKPSQPAGPSKPQQHAAEKSKLQQQQQKQAAEISKPQQALYKEMQNETPINQEKRQIVVDFFNNLIAENRRKELKTVHNYFENLKQKNKLLYENKKMEKRKEIEQETIEVCDFRLISKRVIPPILFQNKRPRLE
ncbi:hypothetical protein BD770DRAFT_398794 [Pilaira anomala]|nr:hypothetical protein BD770DRAFT_398794 [Pilaira anomala]